MPKVSMTVNGKAVTADVDARTLLVQFLRENLRLTGTHVGCDTSQCGACVVHVDGKARQVLHHVRLAGRRRERARPSRASRRTAQLHPMQEAFRENHGLQCGFCTPGHDHDGGRYGATARATTSTTRRSAKSSKAIICRCTGYHNIVKAIAAGAKAMA